ncbi:efflux RND transporter periplasmic adaptor subunit [Siccirubricoccus sp. KC 17139]|uniref:Efflux RND transporter periplasmic adaptor subunit n=1 Tax=Siccirubricoccus soli TaxID=2899147 RepID=A0ABT1D7L0_9PROT|nr:efflux RND transporter periplasmic adaptor subunit [Siccirubricoccus soli]MCO6417859.1 efflux RND transporter periplasmic adaptor subunit [Siccirubricoccus soli]MCP2683994.1 efflux RND transporter periplasmic adaptor subunit [Siccirubricoccus soli]
MRRLLLILLTLGLLGGAGAGGWYWWQQRQPAQPGTTAAAGSVLRRPGGPGNIPVPVTAAAARVQDLPILLEAIGTVQALNTITVRAQVDGQLLEIAFTEGQMVKQGDVLARIDPRPYQAALDQAVAKKAQDEALLANARVDLQRYAQLAANAGVSRQQQDTQRATVAQYEAMVASDQAAIDAARTQLSFTTIRSPIEGRVGLRLVDPGNLVRSGDATGIVTVSQLQPIAVTFTLPQQEVGRVLDALGRGKVPVTALRPGGTAEGELLTLDNAVDPQTGTIKLKAVFPNEDGKLWPGAFVNVRLRIETLPRVTTIPLVAVQRGPEGSFAYVVKPDSTVEQRMLRLGVLTANDAVVLSGVAPGDRVVTSGGLRLSAGATVAVSEDGGPVAPDPVPGQRRLRPRQAADAR